MNGGPHAWDYLVVTASNEPQARTYRSELTLRRQAGALPGVREVLVVSDPEGKRVGSGGSTLECLVAVLERELAGAAHHAADPDPLESVLRRLRILIIHAGGDSRRLPAYGPCGKIFIPVPGEASAPWGSSLFDRIVPGFLALPEGPKEAGQVVITAGDVLVRFDPALVSFRHPGLNALAGLDSPAQTSKHGGFCADAHGTVRLYLQKPDPSQQERLGAINDQGLSLLDIGIMSFDARTALALLGAFGIGPSGARRLAWSEPMRARVLGLGLDFFREVCCALGAEASVEHYLDQVRRSGSTWPEAELRELYRALSVVPFHVQSLSRCRFLHFGTTRQLISSGLELIKDQTGDPSAGTHLSLNNALLGGGEIRGAGGWIEGCRLSQSLTLGGENVVIGIDVDEPLVLPPGACLEVLPGLSRARAAACFVRWYGIDDDFKRGLADGATLLGRPLARLLEALGLSPDEVWDATVAPSQRTLWNARLFPAEGAASNYRRWLWVFEPERASRAQQATLQSADRHSASEIAGLANHAAFFERRTRIRLEAAAQAAPDSTGQAGAASPRN
jgi:fucokinase